MISSSRRPSVHVERAREGEHGSERMHGVTRCDEQAHTRHAPAVRCVNAQELALRDGGVNWARRELIIGHAIRGGKLPKVFALVRRREALREGDGREKRREKDCHGNGGMWGCSLIFFHSTLVYSLLISKMYFTSLTLSATVSR